ncbi:MULTISPECIES: molecular chaperone [Enterobacter]|uniref:Molecular chaperone n=2 Tax=Enterobacter cloacae complex TaxID=354276 RepID=A0A330G7L1_ENTCL|nr:fimbria/pilus periplasmic chaperone [Enterobacter cloacae]RAZ62015.1 molecular chaperone [Enterobacter cloacae]HBM9904660.1 fimbria/pilus periplasmic chaperone [Enterobacter chengduensis]
MRTFACNTLIALAFIFPTCQALAALSVDRSRLIFNEGEKSVSIGITNNNKDLPYLAQAWLEDQHENKIKGKFTILPPLQRIEPDGKTSIRIQPLPDLSTLPQDRESLYYLNLREIPTKDNKENVLTLALQLRLKMFYRPAALKIAHPEGHYPGIENVKLTKKNGGYTLVNPTPYYLTFTAIRDSQKGAALPGFDPVMVSPKSAAELALKGGLPGTSPVLMLIDDYGGPLRLTFNCTQAHCSVNNVISDLSPQ